MIHKSRVINSARKTFWYNRYIGQVFLVVQLIDESYLVVDGDHAPRNGMCSIIQKNDLELLDNTKE